MNAVPVFKPLGLEDRDLFLRRLSNYDFNTYEYSFLTLYLWKKYCNVEYAIIDDALIIKKNQEKKGSYFMQPVGYPEGALQDIVKELIKIKEQDSSFRYLFGDIEAPFLLRLQDIYGQKIKYREDDNNFDYIYETEKLINLTGRKLGKRKNHYNQFIKRYDYSLKDIGDQDVSKDCFNFAELWLKRRKTKHRELIFELEGIGDVLNNSQQLPALGMAVYVKDKIAGFTIGEKVNSRMAIIHVEKGNTRYKGVYAFINKTFAEEYLRDAAYINRQEDLGAVRLREAKRAYDPVKLEKKYLVDLI